ncbi:hypothetical protein M9H77_06850 [Catharanthus roseus]|uniref:Uncharacterized protein n=1 Tax=Catharanthus roseus TaxID=4058 RepID=A0ACC0BTE7_CATRO|nr:hypothetical protein M9H77_06850 [Catharanthus roseus]
MAGKLKPGRPHPSVGDYSQGCLELKKEEQPRAANWGLIGAIDLRYDIALLADSYPIKATPEMAAWTLIASQYAYSLYICGMTSHKKPKKIFVLPLLVEYITAKPFRFVEKAYYLITLKTTLIGYSYMTSGFHALVLEARTKKEQKPVGNGNSPKRDNSPKKSKRKGKTLVPKLKAGLMKWVPVQHNEKGKKPTADGRPRPTVRGRVEFQQWFRSFTGKLSGEDSANSGGAPFEVENAIYWARGKTYYPELVHEFYANIFHNGDKDLSTIISTVKEVRIVSYRERLASIMGITDAGNTITVDSNEKTIDQDPDWNYEITCDHIEIQTRRGEQRAQTGHSWEEASKVWVPPAEEDRLKKRNYVSFCSIKKTTRTSIEASSSQPDNDESEDDESYDLLAEDAPPAVPMDAF